MYNECWIFEAEPNVANQFSILNNNAAYMLLRPSWASHIAIVLLVFD